IEDDEQVPRKQRHADRSELSSVTGSLLVLRQKCPEALRTEMQLGLALALRQRVYEKPSLVGHKSSAPNWKMKHVSSQALHDHPGHSNYSLRHNCHNGPANPYRLC